MVLDTNVKKFKYSYLGKLLCIVLALITGLSAIFLTTAEVLTVINNNVNSNDYSNAIKNGKVFIDGWTASLNGTLQNYKEDVKIVF